MTHVTCLISSDNDNETIYVQLLKDKNYIAMRNFFDTFYYDNLFLVLIYTTFKY